ncbi:MAG: hypothetical protein RPR40_10040 [Bermanella sp.]
MKNTITALVALAIGVFCMPAYSAGLSIDGLLVAVGSGTVDSYLAAGLTSMISARPVLATFLVALPVYFPLLGFIANRTANPLDNAMLILINKILQTLTANSSKNQPDVLSWAVMLTNKPTIWSDLIAAKAGSDISKLKHKLFI